MANYGTTASYAKTLGKGKVARLLHDALTTEKQADERLSEIAEDVINPAAVLNA